MTAENEYRLGRRAFHQNQESSVAVAIAIVAVFLLAGGSYILVSRFHVRSVQLLEGCLYAFFALIAGLELQGSLLGGDAFSMTLGTATKWAVLHLLRFLSVVLFGIRWKLLKTMERETRIEPTTFSLGI